MKYDGNKRVRLSKHALEQCGERGTNEQEIITAISSSPWLPARGNKLECKYAFQHNATWSNGYYAIKEVRPIFVEEQDEIVVVTVYTYYS